jgi:hypothetical protein
MAAQYKTSYISIYMCINYLGRWRGHKNVKRFNVSRRCIGRMQLDLLCLSLLV